jgi:hypothetical protein
MLAHTIQAVVRAIATLAMVVLVIWTAVVSVRWTKRHSTGAQLLAGAMLLVLSTTIPIPKRPQQGLEEAREDKGKKGAESGDPPDDSSADLMRKRNSTFRVPLGREHTERV